MKMSPADDRVARNKAIEQTYVHDVYEQFCDGADSRPWPKVQEFVDQLEPGSIVCDVGCGNGKYLNNNNNLIFNIGGEKCSRLGELAKENDKEVVFLDNLNLPFKDGSLDAVLSIAVVHHFATTERRICALRELARVLRIGGRLIISVLAMEQNHRQFESQDVLIPCHKPQHHLSTTSLDLPSYTYRYRQDVTPDKHNGNRKNKKRHKNMEINSSNSSSTLSSPNETCYSFVRKAIQKLAGVNRKQSAQRPWFLENWSKKNEKRYEPDGCEFCHYENIQDQPIELRRIDEQVFPSTLVLDDLCTDLKSKSMSFVQVTDDFGQSSVPCVIQDVAKSDCDVDSRNSSGSNTLAKPRLVKQKKSICEEDPEEALDKPTDMKNLLINSPETKKRCFSNKYSRGKVLKQRSLNEELMSTERIREKERVRQNIQKQASLNEDLIYQRHNQHTFDSMFSFSTSKRFQLIKNGFTNKIKSSTNNIEKVTGTSLKNGFVRIFQNWKSSELISPTIPEDDIVPENTKPTNETDKKDNTNNSGNEKERRASNSKEDNNSDSSKDSSLQSDTSVDSEDSFASVIFIPRSENMSPTLSPGPISPRLNSSFQNSTKIKQSSCPTSPRIKQMPLSIFPLTKQLSTPKPTTNYSLLDSQTDKKLSVNKESLGETNEKSKGDEPAQNETITCNTKNSVIENLKSSLKDEMCEGCLNEKLCTCKTKERDALARKYSVVQIPKFKPKSEACSSKQDEKNATTANEETVNSNFVQDVSPALEKLETLKKIRDLLSQKPGFGVRTSTSKSNYPIVRHSSVNNGKVQLIAKPLPKLLSLELFNPETDDKDSDSSAVSSPDSVDSVISVKTNEGNKKPTKFPFPDSKKQRKDTKKQQTKKSLLEACADVANSLDEAVEKVIRSSPKAKRKDINTNDVLGVMQKQYYSSDDSEASISNDIPCICPTSDSLVDLSTENASCDSSNCCNNVGTSKENYWDNECHKHLSDFADKLSEKLLQEIDQYQTDKQRKILSSNLENIDISDKYIYRLSEELQDLSKLSAEIQKQNEYLEKLSSSDKACSVCLKNSYKCTKICKESVGKNVLKKEQKSALRSSKTAESISSLDRCEPIGKNQDEPTEANLKPTTGRGLVKTGTSVESCDSEKASSPNSMLSSITTSLHFGHSIESTEGFSDKGSNDSHRDTNSFSRYSDGGSTASLASCPDWKTIRNRNVGERSLSEDKAEKNEVKKKKNSLNNSLISGDNTSQESLPSESAGGQITYHRYYHVFREGEIDQLIEKYVENLHIISSYYDHASWCVIAEKVQVWTI